MITAGTDNQKGAIHHEKNSAYRTMLLSLLGMPAVMATADSTANTTTNLELTENTGPTIPVDPLTGQSTSSEDPDNPATGNTGALTLDVAPRTFDFGSVQTYAAEHTYKATTTTNGQQYLQVTDNRGTMNRVGP
ncbi:WxL domain-containing protein [Lactiplantibacillus plantarum]|uniref:WxL domain-containing protein n=1 Tax=Lactiplantibacillus plantarum TaxID=1590 RepID=UPI0021CB56A1|nr:WxL domain-containing protein [Lactiplantibacillus plantarum]